jgi:hypothetical protein
MTTARFGPPIVIQDQGARAFGGGICGDPKRASIHCDHGYVEWQVPVDPRRLPLLLIHSSSTKTWDTTFAGSEGFRTLFLRRGFAVYVIDPPRTGRAGWACENWDYRIQLGRDQSQITSWRLGIWTPPEPPRFFPNVQFPVDDAAAIDQVLRARYPETLDAGDDDVHRDADANVALLDTIGASVVVTHSGSAIRGWVTEMKSEKVKALVAYEPVHVVVAEDDVKPPHPPGRYRPIPVAAEEFAKLTRIPIQIVFGDNIAPQPTGTVRDLWVEAKANAIDFVAAINARGGHAEVLSLPDVGIRGNTHFAMSDLNNVEIADLLSAFLRKHGLDAR